MSSTRRAEIVAVSPNPSHFGQVVEVTVRGHGEPGFLPFAVRGRHGSTYDLQCLAAACVPGAKPRTLTVDGARIEIVGRVTNRQVADPPRFFEQETRVPPPSYRIAPATLQVVLLVAAAILVAVAVWLARPAVRRALQRFEAEHTPLERALLLARASLRRSPEDRRRAVDLLARTAPTARRPGALELAWSEPDPDTGRVEALIRTIEGDA